MRAAAWGLGAAPSYVVALRALGCSLRADYQVLFTYLRRRSGGVGLRCDISSAVPPRGRRHYLVPQDQCTDTHEAAAKDVPLRGGGLRSSTTPTSADGFFAQKVNYSAHSMRAHATIMSMGGRAARARCISRFRAGPLQDDRDKPSLDHVNLKPGRTLSPEQSGHHRLCPPDSRHHAQDGTIVSLAGHRAHAHAGADSLGKCPRRGSTRSARRGVSRAQDGEVPTRRWGPDRRWRRST